MPLPASQCRAALPQPSPALARQPSTFPGVPTAQVERQAPPPEHALTVQELIAEHPDDVLRTLQRQGVRKLGEFGIEVGWGRWRLGAWRQVAAHGGDWA